MKYIIRKIIYKIPVILLICILMMNFNVVFASSIEINKSVVFLLDSSGSMNENDSEKLALDSIIQLIYSLPSNYKVGVVAYSNNVILKTELVENEDRDFIVNEVEKIEYSGYSNLGKGIQEAIELVEYEKNAQIIMLSDGEILLNTDNDTSNSKVLFAENMQEAKDIGVKVNFIALSDETLIDSEISELSKETGGSINYAVKALDIQKSIDEILINDLGVKKTSLGVTNTKERFSEIEVNLLDGSRTSRILITSTKDILDLIADFESESAIQDVGKRYAFIELKNPLNDVVNLRIKSEGEISIDVISEFNPILNTTVKYIDSKPENKSSEYYERIADIEIDFINEKGKSIFTEELFENSSIEVFINGEKEIATLLDSKIAVSRKVNKDETIEIQVDFLNQPLNILDSDIVLVELKEPPILEDESIYNKIIVLAICCIIFVVSVAILIKSKKKEIVTQKKEIDETISKFNYTGKLNIYITRSKTDRDFPPFTFNLFHISNNRRISLEEILRKLDIEEDFEGAGKIYFTPSVNRKIIVTNESDCTIMKTSEILLKNKSIELFTDSKLDISFEDEISELMLQYKDTK